MFDLVLNSILLFSLLLLAVSLEGSLPSNACPGANANLTTILSRYLIAALVTFPGIAFTRLRDAERTLQRAATKLMSYAGVFSGRAYLSEILISAAVSIAFLGSFAGCSGSTMAQATLPDKRTHHRGEPIVQRG